MEIIILVIFRLIIFIIIGILVGIIYNKLIIRHFSDSKRKLFYFLTMLFFICTAITVSVTISIRSYAISTVNNYSSEIEQYIHNTYSDYDFVTNGIDLSNALDISSLRNQVISELEAIIPTYTELKINKRIYDFINDFAIEGLINQIAVDYIANEVPILFAIADSNNVITINSIMNYIKTTIIMKKIDAVFIRIIIMLITPLLIYFTATFVFALIIIFGRSKTTEKEIVGEKAVVMGKEIVVETNVTQKNWLVVLLLCIFLGTIGVHRFYVGKIGTGILMILTLGGLSIWWLIDLVMIIAGQFTDKSGQKITSKDFFEW